MVELDERRQPHPREGTGLLPELEARRAKLSYKGSKLSEPEASTNDREATFMTFPDGGVRPAYNVRFAMFLPVLLTHELSLADDMGPPRA